jgi:hypothetical protein
MAAASREARDAALKLLADLEHFGAIERPASQRAQAELVRRFSVEAVQPFIDEREELIAKIAEMEEGWRGRVARFLRRLGRLVEES